MKYEVYWTKFASDKLNEIYSYYSEIAGVKITSKVINKIIDKSILLEASPKMGKIEPLLKNHPLEIRFIIFKNYKILYYIKPEMMRIDILNVFDVRQNPRKILT